MLCSCAGCVSDPRYQDHKAFNYSCGALIPRAQSASPRSQASPQATTFQVTRISPSALRPPSASHQVAMKTIKSQSQGSPSPTSPINISRSSTPLLRTTPSPQSPVQFQAAPLVVPKTAFNVLPLWETIIAPLKTAWREYCNANGLNALDNSPYFESPEQMKLWLMYSAFYLAVFTGKQTDLSKINAKTHPPALGSALANAVKEEIRVERFIDDKHAHSLPKIY